MVNICLCSLYKYKKNINEVFMIGKQNILRPLLKLRYHSSAIANHVRATRHNNMWDYFDILTSGKTDFRCK